MARTITKGESYKWWVVAMLWCVCFLNYADRQAIFSIFPTLKKEFGFDSVQLGWIGSAFMWVYALGSPIAGYVGDRFSRKKLILGGCFFWSLVTVFTGWCTKFWHFILVRALGGGGESVYYPSAMSLISDYHDRETRSKAFSFHQSGVYLGTIGGAWLGALFCEKINWQFGFYFFGVAGIVLALILTRFLREPVRGASDGLLESKTPSVAPTVKESLQIMFTRRLPLLLMIAFVLTNFVGTTFLAWMPSFLVDKFGFSLVQAGIGASLIHLASAFGAPVGGFMADFFARRFGGGRMLVQMIGLILGAGFVAAVGLTRNMTFLYISMICFGFCKGIYDSNIFASLYDVIEPKARASGAGILNTVGWTGGALGPLFVGLITKYGRHDDPIENMSEAMAFGSLFYVLAAILLVTVVVLLSKKTISQKQA